MAEAPTAASCGSRWFRILAIGVLLLPGCAVDQAREVETYKEVTRLVVDPLPFEPGAPLTLRDAMMLANEHNERLAIEGENFLQALINKQRAVAAFLPTIDMVYTYSFRDRAGLSGRVDQSTLSAGGTLTLFDGFGNVATLRRELATIEQRRALLLEAQEALLLDVAVIYYQILRAERSVLVLRNSLAVQEERVRETRERHRAGIVRYLDVAQTEAQASATRVSLLNAERDVRNSRAVLAFLTNAPVQDSPLTDRFALPQDIVDLDRLVDLAMRHRQDVLAAEAAAQSARQNVEVAFSQYYPSIALDLDGFLHRSPSFAGAPDWTGLIRANLPLFTAGLIEADVRTAWSVFRQSVLALQLTRRQVMQDVQVAYENLRTSRQRLAELQTQLAAAEQAFRQAEGSYNVGLATNLERVTAQDQLLAAQLELASEQYDQKLFYLDLLRAIGLMREEDALVVPPSDAPELEIDPAAEHPEVLQTPDLVPSEDGVIPPPPAPEP